MLECSSEDLVFREKKQNTDVAFTDRAKENKYKIWRPEEAARIFYTLEGGSWSYKEPRQS